jgi:hypothetical protein
MFAPSGFRQLIFFRIKENQIKELHAMEKENISSLRLELFRVIFDFSSHSPHFVIQMDKLSFKEKLPIAIGALAAFSLPFIIGLVYLYSNK